MRASEPIQIPRAQRFPIRIPLQYRKNDLPDWHDCKTVDISRTGILFQTDQTLAINTALEIRVQFPSSVTLSCQGSVVRTPDSACAIRIHHCHTLPNP
jgi:hypothetical protein